MDSSSCAVRCTQYAPFLVVLGGSALGSLIWASLASGIWHHLASAQWLYRATLLYYVISIMFRKFMLLNRKTLATINHEPSPYFLPLALSIHHKPDRCCLRLFRSTYHGLIRGFWGLKMKTDVWRRQFIIFSSSRTATVLWNPFEKVFTNYHIL